MTLDFGDNNRLQASLYWNLQTLHTEESIGSTDSEILMKHLLRHVKLGLYSLQDPPSGYIVLENLQTLSQIGIVDFREEVFKRIPNLKKLEIFCGESQINSLHCFNNLRKLECLKCHFFTDSLIHGTNSFKKAFKSGLQHNIAFPCSLKKLTLHGRTKIGALPHLQVLKLESNAAAGPDWVTVEGKFCSLKFLLIKFCDDLENWTTDETHFPRLEHLHFEFLKKLTEIPSSIGEISTLESIGLLFCSYSVNMSAERILEEQDRIKAFELKLSCVQEMKMVAVIVIEGMELDFMVNILTRMLQLGIKEHPYKNAL